jgi:hypothetical protein
MCKSNHQYEGELSDECGASALIDTNVETTSVQTIHYPQNRIWKRIAVILTETSPYRRIWIAGHKSKAWIRNKDCVDNIVSIVCASHNDDHALVACISDRR